MKPESKIGGEGKKVSPKADSKASSPCVPTSGIFGSMDITPWPIGEENLRSSQ